MPIILPSQGPARAGTLLELIASVAQELGINAPTQVIGSPDPQIIQLLALANRLGLDLVREHEWQQLTVSASVPTISGQLNYPLQADWNRQIMQTEWSGGRPMRGPVSPQRWQAYKGSFLLASIDARFRIRNNAIELLESPPDGDYLTYEYVSVNWVIGASGATNYKFTKDDDSYVFDESLMIEGLKLRWRKAKGLPYDEAEYTSILDLCKGQNQSAPVLSLNRRSCNRLLDHCNVPESGYGQA